MGPGESRVFIKQNCELDNPSLPGSFGADLQFGLPHFSHWSLLFHHLHVKTLKGTKQELPICLEFKGKRESHHAKVKKNKNKLDLYILPKHFKNSSKHNTTQLSDICLTCFFGFFFSERVGWKKKKSYTNGCEWLPCLWIIPPCSILATEQRCLSLSFRVTP